MSIMTRTFQKKDIASRLFDLGNIILLATLVYSSINLINSIMTPNISLESSDSPILNLQSERVLYSQSYDFTFDPFHRAVIEPNFDIGVSAPETTLSLKLFGLRAGVNGSAILLIANKEQQVYNIGDEIMPGVFLKSVQRDYITLSQNGRLERLTFNKPVDENGLLRAVSR